MKTTFVVVTDYVEVWHDGVLQGTIHGMGCPGIIAKFDFKIASVVGAHNTVRTRIYPERTTESSSTDEEPVWTNCNVCGILIKSAEEYALGMCERCARDWQKTN